MDIRTLQLFDHLASSLHFGRTAEANYISPSTLSRVIQRLEDEAGATLLLRDNRQVRLTAAGRQVSEFARQTVQQWAQLKAQISQQNSQLKGELKLYCSVTASYSHLPALLDKFTSQYPQVEIQLTTGDPFLALDKVMAGEMDIAIAVIGPDCPAAIATRHLDTLPLVLVTAKESKITRLEQIQWPQQPMILPETGPAKRIIHHWLTEQGIRPKVYAHVSGHEAIVSMIALGCGIGIVPKVVVDNSVAASRVNCIPLPGIESFQLGLCCLAERANEPLIKSLLQLT